uniref:Uncharacterized protein n=1 Tax=Photinus pyralis TaxID=7054 RepID=A0A1Y1N6M0_PHOPY
MSAAPESPFKTESISLIQHLYATASVTKVTVRWRDSLRQIMASCIAHCIVIAAGANMAFSAILIPQLRASKDIPITDSEASWIGMSVAKCISEVSQVSAAEKFLISLENC